MSDTATLAPASTAAKFAFDPLKGHTLTLLAELTTLLEIADRLELKIASSSTALGFIIAARLHDRRGGADGGWSSQWAPIPYLWHRDSGHKFPLNAAEPWQMPATSLRLEVICADGRGTPLVARRCSIPAALAHRINLRVRQAQGGNSIQGAIRKTMDVLARISAGDVDRLKTHEHAVVDLDELPRALTPPPAATTAPATAAI